MAWKGHMLMKKKNSSGKPIRVGVFGIGRGGAFTGPGAKAAGFELVALCDKNAAGLKHASKLHSVKGYTDFDKFLEHDMDAVVMANYFHQHAPYAVKALKAGKHVLSETAACHTLGEGVELVRTVEQAGRTYMFSENYAFTAARQEMRRVFMTGEFGTFMYGEGEYVHPMDADTGNSLSIGCNHWRNWIPATYYCTHALSPIMYITETMPVKVNGFVIRTAMDAPEAQRRPRKQDAASMIALRMDNGAVVKLLQISLRGHSGPTRIHAARGFLSDAGGNVTLIREQFHEPIVHPKSMTYAPEFPAMADLASSSGHGGGDFYMMYNFARAIRTGKQPFMNVYRGVAMSMVGILAWRSALNDSNTEIVPDFSKELVRKRYENDDWSPDPARRKPGQPWCSIEGDKKISPFALKYARNIWKKAGYKGT